MAKIILQKVLMPRCNVARHEHTKNVLAGDNYCPVCGENLRPEEEYTEARCSECNFVIVLDLLGLKLEEVKFCPSCGSAFDGIEDKP